jgi:hypothetical protein
MSNESPAQHLAAVLRVVAPERSWNSISAEGKHRVWGRIGASPDCLTLDPTSLSDLARVVAMLDGEQVALYDRALEKAGLEWPHEIITAKAEIHLAALVAATGVRA